VKRPWWKEQLERHYMIIGVILGVCLLAIVATPLIYVFISQHGNNTIIKGSTMTAHLPSGGTFSSTSYAIDTENTTLDLTINSLTESG
jgi:ABC-type glycerol-3-phosphate transport system permease component